MEEKYACTYINKKLIHDINNASLCLSGNTQYSISRSNLYKLLNNLLNPNDCYLQYPYYCEYNSSENKIERIVFNVFNERDIKFNKHHITIKNIKKCVKMTNRCLVESFAMYLKYVKSKLINDHNPIKTTDILFDRLCELINKFICYITENYQNNDYLSTCTPVIMYSIFYGKIDKNNIITILCSRILDCEDGIFYIKLEPTIDNETGCVSYWNIIKLENSTWSKKKISTHIGFPNR